MTYAEHSDHAHYATVVDAFAGASGRTCLAAGPYPTRAEAEAVVEEVTELVTGMRFADVMSTGFLAFGTTRLTMRRGRRAPVGKFNHLLRAA